MNQKESTIPKKISKIKKNPSKALPIQNKALTLQSQKPLKRRKARDSLPARKRKEPKINWSGARVAEEARLESVYTPKGYPEFES
ncbi:MAG: hypothetical protein K2M56_07115, partial [Muribaculaceae bacterium]|nr:hypothetical protein [Muribaculaceae bacterium]